MTLRLSVRQGQTDDLPTIQQLFVDTVSSVCRADYNNDQLSVWTSSVENKEHWQDILISQHLLIAEHQNQIVGFCSLDKGGYIDLLYVHKEHQRQGIAHRLYDEIEKEAKRQGQNQLTADVSITARPFFEKVGFKVTTKQTIVRQGIEITNFKMTKELTKY